MFKKITVIKNEADNDVLFWRSPIKKMDRKTQLLVRPTDIAIFEKGGVLLDVLESGQYDVFDKKSRFYDMFSNNKDTIEVDIIYMSKTVKNHVLWGTPNHITFHDPVYNVLVAVGASGEIDVQIKNPRKFYLELVGRNKHYTIFDLKKRLRSSIISTLEQSIQAQVVNQNFSLEDLPILNQNIQANVEDKLKEMLENEYGITMTSFRLSRIFITPDSKQRIKKVKQQDKENNLKSTELSKDELVETSTSKPKEVIEEPKTYEEHSNSQTTNDELSTLKEEKEKEKQSTKEDTKSAIESFEEIHNMLENM